MKNSNNDLGFECISATLIWSGNYRKLAKWYQDKLGLKVKEELNHPNDTGIAMSIGSSYFWVGKHSGIKGKNKDPFRIMFNIRVPSVTKTYNILKKRGVKIIAAPFKAPTFDKYFVTFSDLDGNTIQLIGNK